MTEYLIESQAEDKRTQIINVRHPTEIMPKRALPVEPDVMTSLIYFGIAKATIKHPKIIQVDK
ncbi:MAG: hypothetical protein AUH15_11780 [Acidobacteriales bacterium 13_2_20CM_55_8]|nr:MAG: hypothetical protein AUH15_11780 [Acidobacteriales bacterium 13_2_20CM_55_8]